MVGASDQFAVTTDTLPGVDTPVMAAGADVPLPPAPVAAGDGAVLELEHPKSEPETPTRHNRPQRNNRCQCCFMTISSVLQTHAAIHRHPSNAQWLVHFEDEEANHPRPFGL
jgi:hypothetical protein